MLQWTVHVGSASKRECVCVVCVHPTQRRSILDANRINENSLCWREHFWELNLETENFKVYGVITLQKKNYICR